MYMTDTAKRVEPKFSCVAQTLRKAARLITRRYEDVLRPFNLTASQFSILQAVTLQKFARFKMLASLLGIEQTTLTRLLKILEKRGLIEVGIDPEDARSRVISATIDGQDLFQNARLAWQSVNNESLSRLKEEDWDNAQAVLTILSK